jgi:type IV secretory pathway TrbD component
MSPNSTSTVSSPTATSNPTTPEAEGEPRVVVPADIDTPDRIAWGLSFRQLAILAGGLAPAWLAYTRFGPLLPPAAWVGIGILIVAVSVVVALGRRDGLPLDVWIRHGLALHAGPRALTPGTPTQGRPLLVTAPVRPSTPAPLRPEVTQIAGDGTVTVDGTARVVIACGTTGIGLRTPTEQAGLLEGFGQWLNALAGGVQIVVSAARHDLTGHAEAILDVADRLPHPALRAAAAGHAGFLLDLDATREPLHRQVLTIVPAGHAVETTTRALTGLGITATPLDGGCLAAALVTALDPHTPPAPGPRAVPGTPITATLTTSTVGTASPIGSSRASGAGRKRRTR